MIALETIGVYVIEGQALFGKALCQIFSLDPVFQIVGDSSTIVAEKLTAAKPDVILMDLDGLPGDVAELIGTCRAAAPSAKVCVLSMRVLPELVHRCMNASAEGFIMKDVMPAELAQAVKMVAEGHSYVDPRAAGKLLRNRGASRGDFFDLSNREVDIIKLVAEGLANKEISSRLHLSEKTVKNHMGRIFSKLNLSTRSQAAIYAIKNGLI